MTIDDRKTLEELQRELLERQLAEQRRMDDVHVLEIRARAAKKTARLNRLYGTRAR